jgi:hypothetical protein
LYRPNISDSRLINNEGAAFALPHCAGADPVWGFDPASIFNELHALREGHLRKREANTGADLCRIGNCYAGI